MCCRETTPRASPLLCGTKPRLDIRNGMTIARNCSAHDAESGRENNFTALPEALEGHAIRLREPGVGSEAVACIVGHQMSASDAFYCWSPPVLGDSVSLNSTLQRKNQFVAASGHRRWV